VATVLIVEDEEIVRAMLSAQFSDRGHAVHTAESGERAIEIGRQLRPGVMVADFALPGLGGPATFAALRAEQPELHGYGMSGVYAPDEGARLAHSVGMIAFFSKPFQPAELIALVEANLRSQQPRRALAPKRFTNQPTNQPTLRTAGAAAGLPTGMVGTCAAIEEVRRLIRRVAPLPARVLVTGETGTGKELVARAIHDVSPRRLGPFVAVNCGALPRELVEAELFGAMAGAGNFRPRALTASTVGTRFSTLG
jgi:DNA-binding NtrC family response regulator